MTTKPESRDETPIIENKIPCEVYSRIVGYLRPVQAWNKGKQQEFAERATFDASVEDSERSGM